MTARDGLNGRVFPFRISRADLRRVSGRMAGPPGRDHISPSRGRMTLTVAHRVSWRSLEAPGLLGEPNPVHDG